MKLRLNKNNILKSILGPKAYREYKGYNDNRKYTISLEDDYPFDGEEDFEYSPEEDDYPDFILDDPDGYYLDDEDYPDFSEDDAYSIEPGAVYYESIAKRIYNLSQYYVPVDTGNLKRSAEIIRHDNGILEISYSSKYNVPYALYVHEISFNNHKEPTKYKYLEDAALVVLNEVYAESGNILNIKISYDPLSIFVIPEGLDIASGAYPLTLNKPNKIKKANVNYWNALLNNTGNERRAGDKKRIYDFSRYWYRQLKARDRKRNIKRSNLDYKKMILTEWLSRHTFEG